MIVGYSHTGSSLFQAIYENTNGKEGKLLTKVVYGPAGFMLWKGRVVGFSEMYTLVWSPLQFLNLLTQKRQQDLDGWFCLFCRPPPRPSIKTVFCWISLSNLHRISLALWKTGYLSFSSAHLCSGFLVAVYIPCTRVLRPLHFCLGFPGWCYGSGGSWFSS